VVRIWVGNLVWCVGSLDYELNDKEFSVQYAADVPGSGRCGSVL